MKPRILNRYIMGELAGPFFFGIMAFTLIMVAGGLLFKLADLIIERGVSLSVVARLFVYQLPSVVVLTLPMSCLLASLLGFGKMSSNSEIIALKAAGISFRRICFPVLVAAVGMSLFSLLVNETVVPLGMQASQNVMRYEVIREAPSLVKEQVFLKDSDGPNSRVLYVNRLVPNTGQMENIIIQELEDGVLKRITVAESAKWENSAWVLSQGDVFEVRPGNQVSLLMHFDRQRLTLPLSPNQIARTSLKPDDMSAYDLYHHIELMKVQGMDVRPLWVTFHLRLAVPWACLILAFIGATLGVRSQRKGGSGISFGQSILLVFAYYVVMSIGQSLAQAGYMPVVVGAWLPNILFFVCGMFLARRADR